MNALRRRGQPTAHGRRALVQPPLQCLDRVSPQGHRVTRQCAGRPLEPEEKAALAGVVLAPALPLAASACLSLYNSGLRPSWCGV